MSLYSIMFGERPEAGDLVHALGLQRRRMGRYRDCYVIERKGKRMVALLTRLGGANRPDYPAEIAYLHTGKGFIADEDDAFDETFATFLYAVPDGFEQLPTLPEFRERYEDHMARMKAGKLTPEEQARQDALVASMRKQMGNLSEVEGLTIVSAGSAKRMTEIAEKLGVKVIKA